MKRRVYSEDEAKSAARDLDGWEVEGKELVKSLKFENFAEALAFVNRIGELAEKADHHPDIKFGWGFAEIRLTTHDSGGITDADFDLAKEISAL